MTSLVNNSIKYNKNKDNYIFHPRNSLFHNMAKIQSSQSAQNIFNSRENIFNSYFDNSLDKKDIRKLNPGENTFYNKRLFPPIYFYRKVQCPYKYNITSIPEYLIKTNEEKNFMDKLESHMKDKNDKKKFNELIQKRKKEIKIKDRYKPEILDVQTILKYRPNLFNSLKFSKKHNSDINDDSPKKTVNINNDKEENKEEINNKNYEIKKEEISEKQMSDKDQIKYKVSLCRYPSTGRLCCSMRCCRSRKP